MQELKDENGRLYKLLAEREEEMIILRKQVNQERQAMIGNKQNYVKLQYITIILLYKRSMLRRQCRKVKNVKT